jgi:hypothetical protein
VTQEVYFKDETRDAPVKGLPPVCWLTEYNLRKGRNRMQIANMISENNACESSQTKWQVICCLLQTKLKCLSLQLPKSTGELSSTQS